MKGPPKFRGDPNRLTFEEMQAVRDRISSDPEFIKPLSESLNRSQTLVRIKAHTTLVRFQPVCIDTPQFIPDSRTRALTYGMANTPIFNTVAFSATKAWVVCAEGIATGKIGWAVLSGLTPCRIYITDNSAIKLGCHITSDERLEIANGGPARVLYVRGGTELQPAIIELCPVPPRFVTGITVGSIASGALGSVSVNGLGTFAARHIGTVTIATSKTVGITWDDGRREYVVTMEFC